MLEPKLTAKQKAFCHEYAIDKNATQAAIRAGYSKATAHQIAAENLRKPYVKAYLDELLSRQTERTKITGDKVISELTAIAGFQLTDVIELSGSKLTIKNSQAWSDTAKRAIESLRIDKDGAVHIKAHSKIAALKQLGEHFGVFNDFNAALATLSRFGYVMTKGDHDVDKGFTWQPELSAEDEDDEPTAINGWAYPKRNPSGTPGLP
jgi:phage terminase small subunit